MIINARLIARPRRLRYYAHCGQVITGPALRQIQAALTAPADGAASPVCAFSRCSQGRTKKNTEYHDE